MSQKQSIMLVQYWGVRGSIPCPLTNKQIEDKQVALLQYIMQDKGNSIFFQNTVPTSETIREYLHKLPLSISGTYGGDTTCLEIQAKDSPLIIIDAGTGIRFLGQSLLKKIWNGQKLNPLADNNSDTMQEIHVFFTHYHWDHIQGIPFFAPAFLSENQKIRFHFYGKKNMNAEVYQILFRQQEYPNFPVIWNKMPCEKVYHDLNDPTQKIQLGALCISYQELSHPDSVLAYRFEIEGKSFVCATDTEHKNVIDPRLVSLAEDADIMYYDGQYTPEEYNGAADGFPRVGWGHSTYEWAIKTALEAHVKTLVLGHHDPRRDDFQLDDLKKKAIEYQKSILQGEQKIDIQVAYQGMVHNFQS